jgi:phosphoribosylamine--glycine ligase
MKVKTDPRTACTIVAVSGGYPEHYKKGFTISGLEAAAGTDVSIFHMGTQLRDGVIVTSGGRVLCVTAFGNSVVEAAKHARSMQEKIQFEGKYFRGDIGFEFN